MVTAAHAEERDRLRADMTAARWRRLALWAALCLALAGCGLVSVDQPAKPAPTQIAAPRNIELPTIGASSSLVPVGLTRDGQQEVPDLNRPEQAAWFRGGPEPGEKGAAVILGHINGRGHDGVFAHLDRIEVGDPIHVDDRTFTVTEVGRFPKDQFPTGRVYGPKTASPELRLITCGGAFDKVSGNYADNLIVFATLATG